MTLSKLYIIKKKLYPKKAFSKLENNSNNYIKSDFPLLFWSRLTCYTWHKLNVT